MQQYNPMTDTVTVVYVSEPNCTYYVDVSCSLNAGKLPTIILFFLSLPKVSVKYKKMSVPKGLKFFKVSVQRGKVKE